MGSEIDSLDIQIKTTVDRASNAIDKLIGKLERLSGAFEGIEETRFTEFSNGIDKIIKSSERLSGIRTSDFNKLANGIKAISEISTSGIIKTSLNLRIFASGMNKIGAVSQNAKDLGYVSNSIAKLGGKNIENAIDNMPRLASGLNKMMTTLSKTPTVSNNLIQMTSALSGLAENINGVRSISDTSTKSSGSLKKLSDAMSILSGKSRKCGSSLKSFSQIAGSFYANSFMFVRGVKKLGSAIEKSMDYTETYNYYNVTMDKIAKEFSGQWEKFGYENAEDYANSFSNRLNNLTQKMTGFSVGNDGVLSMTNGKNLGLDPNEMMNFQASIAAITNSVGLMGENSINTSKALSMLSADLSSLKNIDLSTAMTNLQSGLIGQSRALYKYGIDITNATLQTYAYKYGLNMAVSEMTQADKMQLRLLAILDQSRVAWGDQANSINTVANQYRILKQQVSNLARVLGTLLMPIVQKVLPVINGLVISLQKLFIWVGNLIGIDWGKTMDGISKGYSGGTDGIDDFTDGTDEATQSMNNAAAAAKKLKNTILGFDEINALNDNSDVSSGSSSSAKNGGGIDLSNEIGALVAEYESVWEKALQESENKAQEYADKITSYFQRMYAACEPFRESMKRLWDEGLSKLGNFAWTALKDFYEQALVPLGTWAFGTEGAGLTRLVDVINNGLMAIEWDKLNKSLKEFWKAIEPYAEQFGEGLIDFFEDVQGLAVDVINAFPGLLDKITSSLNKGDPERARSWGYSLGVLAVGLMAFKGIASVISGIANFGLAMKELQEGLGAIFGSDGIFAKIGSKISGSFGALTAKGGILEGISAGPIIAVVAAIAALAAGLTYAYQTNEEVRQSFADATSSIREGLQPIIEFFTGTVLPDLKSAWQGLLDILSPLGEFLSGAFASIWMDIINPALTYIGETVLPVLNEAFKGLWNKVLAPLGSFIGSVLKPAFQILADVLTMLWKNIVLPLADAFGTLLKGAFEICMDVLNNIVIPIVGAVIDVMSWLWNNVLSPIVDFLWDVFAPVFEEVFKSIGGIIDGLKQCFQGLIKFVDGVFSGDWKKAWEGIRDIFKGIWEMLSSILKAPFNAVLALFESLANKIIDGFNGIKKKINSFKIDVPDWMQDTFGMDAHIGTHLTMSEHIDIPRFDQGGFPETGQLFLARENGLNEMIGRIGNHSAVANNDQITQAFANEIRPAMTEAFVEALMMTSGATSNDGQAPVVEVTIKADSETVYNIVRKGKEKHDRRYHVVTEF